MQHTQALNEDHGPDYNAIKRRQQATWGSGDYGRIGVTLQLTGEELCEALDVHAGATVLDVAGGNGNVSLAAARRFCKVVSTDYVEGLLEQSRARADAERLAIDYQFADAENLPFANASFDHVVSTFGVMFAPDQAQAAAELLRVCRPGGKIGLASWTPDGFIGRLLKTVGRHVAPPAGVRSPALWGTDQFLTEQYAGKVSRIDVETKQFVFRYRTPEHFLQVFRDFYGPVHKAFSALDEQRQAALSTDILAVIEEFNGAEDGSMRVPSDYLEVVITH